MTLAAARPQTIASELLDRVERLVHSPDGPTKFELVRLKADADRLQKVDAAEASTVKAAIAGMEWDIEGVVRWSNNAISLKNSEGSYANAAINYQIANMLEAAISHARAAVQRAPQRSAIISIALAIFRSAGMWTEATRIASGLNMDAAEKDELVRESQVMLDAMAGLGLTEDDQQAEISAAVELARINKVRIKEIRQSIFADPELGKQIVVELLFNGTIEEELLLEEQLASKLAGMSHWNPSKLSVEFSYLS